MLKRLPKKYREKYKQELGMDEEILLFAFKLVGSASLLLVIATGLDLYQLIH